jgi:bZIP transcription factor
MSQFQDDNPASPTEYLSLSEMDWDDLFAGFPTFPNEGPSEGALDADNMNGVDQWNEEQPASFGYLYPTTETTTEATPPAAALQSFGDVYPSPSLGLGVPVDPTLALTTTSTSVRQSTPPISLTPADERPSPRYTGIRRSLSPNSKRLVALERNRIAATKCRAKKKKFLTDLQERQKALEERHAELQAELAFLTRHLGALNQWREDHVAQGCTVLVVPVAPLDTGSARAEQVYGERKNSPIEVGSKRNGDAEIDEPAARRRTVTSPTLAMLQMYEL